jgi:hypothetical protein
MKPTLPSRGGFFSVENMIAYSRILSLDVRIFRVPNNGGCRVGAVRERRYCCF